MSVYIHLLYLLFLLKCFVRFSFIFFYAHVNSIPQQLYKSPKVEQQWNATFNITHAQNVLSRTTIALIPKSGYVGIRSRGLNEHNLVYIFFLFPVFIFSSFFVRFPLAFSFRFLDNTLRFRLTRADPVEYNGREEC